MRGHVGREVSDESSLRSSRPLRCSAIPTASFAETDKYNVTPDEHAACDADAYRLCSQSQDEDQLLVCMKRHRSELTSNCRVTFIAGLKRRHLRM